jgi:hypothetical protein
VFRRASEKQRHAEIGGARDGPGASGRRCSSALAAVAVAVAVAVVVPPAADAVGDPAALESPDEPQPDNGSAAHTNGSQRTSMGPPPRLIHDSPGSHYGVDCSRQIRSILGNQVDSHVDNPRFSGT